MAIAGNMLQDRSWQILVDGSSGTTAIVESRVEGQLPDGVPDSPGGCTVRTN